MIITVLFTAIIGIFGLIMGLFPTIEVLPFGIDTAMVFFVSTIKAILEIMPIFQVVWNLLILALTVKMLLFTWYWFKWLLERIR